MSDDSEEKVLPPTEHKLRKAREKGQLASSQDFVTATVTSCGLIYLMFAWQGMAASFNRVFDITISMMNVRTGNPLMTSFYAMMYEIGTVIVPLAVIVTIVGILANILHKQGIPFSLHPIKPDFNKINPGQGFKKIFSRRNATEFAISFVRMCVWFFIAGVIIWMFLPGTLASTLCKGNCLLNEANQMMIVLIVTVVVLLMAAGLADLPIQYALFNHEQKMGHKELKREMKDTMGSPEFKAHRKREYQEMLEEATNKIGPGFILSDGNVVVGLYYDPTEAPVPKVVVKFQAKEAHDAIKQAEAQNIKVINERQLTLDIYRSVTLGSMIKQRQLGKVAMLMVREGLI